MSNNEIFDKDPVSINFQKIHPNYLPALIPGAGNLASVLAQTPNPGSANCQAITNLFGISSCPANDFQITSQGPNSDIILENNNSADGILLNAGTSIQLNTDQFASGANTSVNCTTGHFDIQPNVGYPYTSTPSIGLHVHSYSNPTGTMQDGIRVNATNAVGGSIGLRVQNTTSSASTATGQRIATTAGQGAIGLEIASTVASGARAYGIQLSTVSNTGTSFSRGIDIQNVSCTNSEAIGINVNNVYTNPATGLTAVGVSVSNVNQTGTQNAVGLHSFSCSAGNDAFGLLVDNIVAGNQAFGARFSRGSKIADADGRQVKLVDGSLSLCSVYYNLPGVNILSCDGGNFGLIGPLVPANPTLTPITIGTLGTLPQNGDWFLLSHPPTPYDIVDANGLLVSGAPTYTTSLNMTVLFFVSAVNQWVAYSF